MDSYLAGFLVGLLCVFAVGTILRLVRRKRGTERAKYDERQLTARGIAYRLAYFTLMLALLADVSATALLRPWAERGVDVFLCVFLSIGVFVVACVHWDAYFTLTERPRSWLLVFALVIACQIPNTVIHARNGDFVKDGLLTYDVLLPACALLFLVILICALVRIRRDREDDAEE